VLCDLCDFQASVENIIKSLLPGKYKIKYNTDIIMEIIKDDDTNYTWRIYNQYQQFTCVKDDFKRISKEMLPIQINLIFENKKIQISL